MKVPKTIATIGYAGVGTLAIAGIMLSSGCATHNANQTRILESRKVIPAPYDAPLAAAPAAAPEVAVFTMSPQLTSPFQPVAPVIQEPAQVSRPTAKTSSLSNYQPPPINELDTVAAPSVTTTPPLPSSAAKTPAAKKPEAASVKVPDVPEKDMVSTTGNNCLKYTVKRGDTLSAIARTHGMSTQELALFNKLDANGKLLADATLLIPQKDAGATPASVSASNGAKTIPAAVQTTSGAAAGQTYKVEKGDSLWAIAKSFGLSTNELASYNKRDVNAVLVEGSTLRLPPSAKMNAGGPATSSHSALSSAKPMVASVSGKSTSTYTVQKGDSLSVVAHRYDMSVDDLKQLNGLTSDIIQVGQVLKVTGTPKSASQASSKSSTSSTAKVVTASATPSNTLAPTLLTATMNGVPAADTSTPGVVKHTVKSGDNLWTIAHQYKTSGERILQLNKLKNDKLFPGMVLVVKDDNQPVGASPAAASAPATSSTAGKVTMASSTGSQGSLITGTTVVPAQASPRTTVLGNIPAVQAVSAAKANGLTTEQVMALQQLPHTVESTDTLASIAALYQTQVEWIKVANPSIKADADLKTVTTIKVPMPAMVQ